jgi:phage shock protein PspC (stress-responsive transcriptional regulator)
VLGDRTVEGGGGTRAATTSEGVSDVTRRLSRPRDDRWIAGVCAGLGRRFGLSSGVVRLLFVLSCLLPGPQVLVYIVLWAIMPSE